MANESPQQIGLQAIFEDADFQKGVQEYEKGVEKAGAETEKGASLFSKLGTVAQTTLLAGLTAAASGFGLIVGATKGGLDALASWNDQVNTLSDNLGTSGAESSKWVVAFNHVGLSVDEGAAGLNAFTNGLADLGKAAPKTTTTIKDNSAVIGKLNEQLETAKTRLQRATEKFADAKNPTKAMQWAIEDAQKAVDTLNEKLATTPATIETVSTSAPKLTPFAEALENLGVSAVDSQGNLKTFDQIMPELLDAFKRLPPGIDKSALAMELFGTRAGTKFLDFLSQGSEGLDQATKFAKDFGLELSTDTSNNIEEFGFILNDLRLGAQGFLIVIGKAMLPILRDLSKVVLTDILPPLIDWAQDVLPRVVEGVQHVVEAVLPFVAGLGGLVIEIGKVLTTSDLFEDFGSDFARLFGDNEGAVQGLMTKLGEFVLKVKDTTRVALAKFQTFWENLQPTLENVKKWFSTEGVDALEVFFKKVEEMQTRTLPKWNDTLAEMEKTWTILFGKDGKIKTDSEFTLPKFADLVDLVMTRGSLIFETKLDLIQTIFRTFNDALLGNWEKVFKHDMQAITEDAFDALLGMFAQDGEALRAVWEEKMSEVVDVVFRLKGSLHDEFVQVFVDLPGQFNEAAGAMMQSLIDGFNAQGAAVQQALQDIIQAAIDNLWNIFGGGGQSVRRPEFAGGGAVSGAVLDASRAAAVGLRAGRSVPSAIPSFNGVTAAQALQTIQIFFQGTGGPATKQEAETQGGWIVNAMVSRGVRF